MRELMENESGSEDCEMLAKIDECPDETENDEDDESSDVGCVPATIKTDLFGTEGDDD